MKAALTISLVLLSCFGCARGGDGNGIDGRMETPARVDSGIAEFFETLLDSSRKTETEVEENDSTMDRLEESEQMTGESMVVVKLTPDQYTNEPIIVGQGSYGFQFDDVSDPVQAVMADERCAVVHGFLSQVETLQEYKVKDADKKLGLAGVKIVTKALEFGVEQGETYFGNEKMVKAQTLALAFCDSVLVEKDNTLYEGEYGGGEGCEVPFIVDGTTYMAHLGTKNGCSTFSLEEGDEVILFGRYIEEEDKSYVIAPVIVENGEAWSPCFPIENADAGAFEAQLKGMLE